MPLGRRSTREMHLGIDLGTSVYWLRTMGLIPAAQSRDSWAGLNEWRRQSFKFLSLGPECFANGMRPIARNVWSGVNIMLRPSRLVLVFTS